MVGSDDTGAVLLCSGALDSTTELASLEDDGSEELVLAEPWLVEPVLGVVVEELLDVLLELF